MDNYVVEYLIREELRIDEDEAVKMLFGIEIQHSIAAKPEPERKGLPDTFILVTVCFLLVAFYIEW